jgi:BON domain
VAVVFLLSTNLAPISQAPFRVIVLATGAATNTQLPEKLMVQNKHPSASFRPRREVRRTPSSWWQDEPPIPYTGSSADPLFDDYNGGERSPWAPAYIGEGNYWSGEFPADEDCVYDYGYAGLRGDAGLDEVRDQQYGGGRYAAGPDEQSSEFGAGYFRAGHGPFGRLQRGFDQRQRREMPAHPEDIQQPYRPVAPFPGALGWHDAMDWADPAGYRVFRHRERESRGRGPKNYRHMDESILDEIYLKLLSESGVDSSDVTVEVHHGVAFLTGSVAERGMRYAIEDLAAGVHGVREVENRIKINRLYEEPA